MTAFDIYSAVGGAGEDILEESEIMPKKKITKIIPLMTAAACFAVVAVGLSHALRSGDIEQPVPDVSSITTYEMTGGTSGTVTETPPAAGDVTAAISDETAVPEDTTSVEETSHIGANYDIMPEPFGTAPEAGGDEHADYYRLCKPLYDGIPVELMKLRDSGEVTEWLEKDKLITRSEVSSSITDNVNIYAFITAFNITREEAETALEHYLNTPEEYEHIQYEDLDIIYSGDIELITKTFASEASIVVGDRIYSPEWVYTHSPEEYEAAGITKKDILSKVEWYSRIMFTDEARLAFSEKLSAYTGEQVVIKTLWLQEKGDVTIVQDDIMEDEWVEDFEEYEEELVVPEVYE